MCSSSNPTVNALGEPVDPFVERLGVDVAGLDESSDEGAIRPAPEPTGDRHSQLRHAEVMDLEERQQHWIVGITAVANLLGQQPPLPSDRKGDLRQRDAVRVDTEALV
jgi:hypothetical protein